MCMATLRLTNSLTAGAVTAGAVKAGEDALVACCWVTSAAAADAASEVLHMVATTRLLLLLLLGGWVGGVLGEAGALGWVLQEAGRGTGKPDAAAAAILWLCTAMRPPQNRMMGVSSVPAAVGHRTALVAWVVLGGPLTQHRKLPLLQLPHALMML